MSRQKSSAGAGVVVESESQRERFPYWTVGDMARDMGVALHQVEFVVRSREVPHDARIGCYRLFGRKQMEFVRGEIEGIRKNRTSAATATHE